MFGLAQRVFHGGQGHSQVAVGKRRLTGMRREPGRVSVAATARRRFHQLNQAGGKQHLALRAEPRSSTNFRLSASAARSVTRRNQHEADLFADLN
jgi:hypothetical protein